MNNFIAFAQSSSSSTVPMFILLLIPIAITGIIIFFFVFWIMMIIHAATYPVENKTVWIIVLILTGFLGAIAYYFVIKRNYINVPVQQTNITPSL